MILKVQVVYIYIYNIGLCDIKWRRLFIYIYII